jgi:hypothetical protein
MARLQIPQSKINTLQIEAEKNNTFIESMINLSNEEVMAITQGPIDHLNSTDHNHSCVLCHNILVGSELFTSPETGA